MKFRLFNKEQEKYTYISVDSLSELSKWIDDNENSNFSKFERPLIFTGLVTTGGSEIYEGDILQEKLTVDDWINGAMTAIVDIVYVKDGEFFVKQEALKYYVFKDNICEDWQVVGNIYEDKELFNQLNK